MQSVGKHSYFFYIIVNWQLLCFA